MEISPRWSTADDNIVLITPPYNIKHRYNIQKHINENMNVTTIQWNNNPYIGYI